VQSCPSSAEHHTIHTRYGGEAQPVIYPVRNGELQDTGDIFHFSTPAARWWDNVIFACSSFQPFRTVADARDWCRRHDFPEGATMSLPALWRFASEWYGSYLSQPWRKRSVAQAQELFRRHELVGPFWDLEQGMIYRGEQPFLHAWKANQPAISLYESLGFQIRTEVDVKMLERVGFQA